MFFNKALTILYIIVLAMILIELFEFWGLAVILMLFLVITLVQKISIESRVEETEKARKNMIDLITEKLDVFSNRIGAVSYTHLRAHETLRYLVCRLLLEKKKTDKSEKY